MTNLEWFINKENVTAEGRLCAITYLIDKKCQCNQRCDDCTYKTDKNRIKKILLADHKESIKLKQWEIGLLSSLYNTAEDRFVYMGAFKYHAILRNMKTLGYFKGVTNTSMTLEEILDNCEVVDD